ncbi:hypothetical protein [Hymenobacter weizhouensis]|uniref:hypothetical protein n=1 Tax=Hymenobacter sp. YIM 151500-1 TaxID=2987689 RepID=UPI002226145E|nr:hypothetical protein [Hymenobacter sp. YIM 151500-1]UYZ64338.1 hypothetical protein OIS53_05680 [Hymenobacter sp. YIM 151500-1]
MGRAEVQAYLRLRARVVGRQLRELGWWRLVALGLLLGLALARALATAAARPATSWLVPPAVALFVASGHRRRADLTFLALTMPQPRPGLAAEYSLLATPAALALLAWGRWGPALLTVALAAAVAWLPAATAGTGSSRRRSLFRSVAFEWVSGGRRGLLVAWAGLLGVSVYTRATAAGPALALVAWLLLLVPLYGTPEPWPQLLAVLRSPAAWLRGRVGWGLLYFGLTSAPLAWVLAGGPAGWAGTAGLLAWCAVVLTMLVLAKYAFYPQALLAQLAQAGVVVVGLSILSNNPAYLALLVACLLGLLWKSSRRLSHFRHD